jgi:hypothetical protein
LDNKHFHSELAGIVSGDLVKKGLITSNAAEKEKDSLQSALDSQSLLKEISAEYHLSKKSFADFHQILVSG